MMEAQLQIEHYWAGALRRAVIEGDVETGSVMAGQSVGMVKDEAPVADHPRPADGRGRARAGAALGPRLNAFAEAGPLGGAGLDARATWRRIRSGFVQLFPGEGRGPGRPRRARAYNPVSDFGSRTPAFAGERGDRVRALGLRRPARPNYRPAPRSGRPFRMPVMPSIE